jgi:hypothetical protein
MTKASKPTPKQNHPDQLDLIDCIKEKEAEPTVAQRNAASKLIMEKNHDR